MWRSVMGNKRISRRKFVAKTGTAALTFSIVKAQLVKGSDANSKIQLGLIGCGGRGTWITELFQKHGGYDISACADYFQYRADNAGEKFSIPANRRFTGLMGYQKLLDAKVDAVAIESPPYFHPQQAEASVLAGCHTYLAKPIAVDVPGSFTIKKYGQIAREKNLCFLVDFQTRANEFFLEALKRVHEGAIGDFAFGEATYHAGSPFDRMEKYLEKDNITAEDRLEAWGLSRLLSGDIITEQNIHTLDVMNWIMDQDPLFADGACGHKVRKDKGTCCDTFTVLYQYPEKVGITFSSRQFNGHDTQPEGIRNRMFGSKGVLETEYGGRVLIRGENFYRGGKTPDIYREGAENNIAAFYDSIQNGNYSNSTVEPSFQSNMITILGRKAAYSGERVYWEQLLKDSEKLEFDTDGLKM